MADVLDSINNVSNIGIRNLIMYFILFTLYCFVIYNVKSIRRYQFTLFFVIMISMQFGLNYSTSSYICSANSTNNFNTFLHTVIPYVFILGLGHLFLSIFPGWLRIFSNTIGMFIAYEKNSDEINKLLQNANRTVKDNSLTPDQKAILLQVLDKPKLIINEIDIIGKSEEEITKLYEKLQVTLEELFKPESKEMIIEIVKTKNAIGYTLWYFVLGIITVMVSTNSLLSSNCGLSL